MTAHKSRLALALATLALGMSLNARAALIPGVIRTDPFVQMTASTYIVYDHNAGGTNGSGASIGRLSIVTQAETLNEGAVAGGSSAQNTYAALTQVINIDFASSGAGAGAFVGGTVSILAGSGTQKFQWLGTLSNAGFNTAGTAPLLNGTWTVSSDSYAFSGATATNLSQFVNNYLLGGSGGLLINTSGAGFTLANANLATDWIVGSGASAPTTLPTAISSGLTSAAYYSANVTVDVYATPVPLPASTWAMLGGLLLLLPALRGRRASWQPASLQY